MESASMTAAVAAAFPGISKVVRYGLESGPIWPPKWSDMALKLVRYGLETGPIWISVLPYRTTLETRPRPPTPSLAIFGNFSRHGLYKIGYPL